MGRKAKAKPVKKQTSRLTKELLEIAKAMHASGLLTDAGFVAIKRRHIESASTLGRFSPAGRIRPEKSRG